LYHWSRRLDFEALILLSDYIDAVREEYENLHEEDLSFTASLKSNMKEKILKRVDQRLSTDQYVLRATFYAEEAKIVLSSLVNGAINRQQRALSDVSEKLSALSLDWVDYLPLQAVSADDHKIWWFHKELSEFNWCFNSSANANGKLYELSFAYR
jgi:hypothetical protein